LHANQNKSFPLNVPIIYQNSPCHLPEGNNINSEKKTYNSKKITISYGDTKADFHAKYLKLHSIKYEIKGYVAIPYFHLNFKFSHFWGQYVGIKGKIKSVGKTV
jgi:hypothetical protein